MIALQTEANTSLFDQQPPGRRALARALTLIESTNPAHQARARALVDAARPRTGNAIRIGITGVPGVGKSSFIESFGQRLLDQGRKLAILAVDPSSQQTGGSILGDKTRMASLATDRRCFIRPSPSSGAMGGVARTTREAMLVLEAAGFDVILVETVGVGQSETMVADMVDLFMVLMMPGTGDELQGIKKGVLELADMIVVNKADGDLTQKAKFAARQYQNALALVEPISANWTVPVLLASALEQTGLNEIWSSIQNHRQTLTASGELQTKRQQQLLRWFKTALHDQILSQFFTNPTIKAQLPQIEQAILNGQTSPYAAAASLIARTTPP